MRMSTSQGQLSSYRRVGTPARSPRKRIPKDRNQVSAPMLCRGRSALIVSSSAVDRTKRSGLVTTSASPSRQGGRQRDACGSQCEVGSRLRRGSRHEPSAVLLHLGPGQGVEIARRSSRRACEGAAGWRAGASLSGRVARQTTTIAIRWRGRDADAECAGRCRLAGRGWLADPVGALVAPLSPWRQGPIGLAWHRCHGVGFRRDRCAPCRRDWRVHRGSVAPAIAGRGHPVAEPGGLCSLH
jgi:hypothetical protein